MCHKTAGLVANALEHAGIATVVIGTLPKPLESVPRAIVTEFVDHPIGPPDDTRTHQAVIEQALELLRSAKQRTMETFARSLV